MSLLLPPREERHKQVVNRGGWPWILVEEWPVGFLVILGRHTYRGMSGERDDHGMDNAEIERILRALRTPLGISARRESPAECVAELMRVDRRRRGTVGGELAAGQRRPKTRVKDVGWIPEAEAWRLRKAIRTSFCNSPHQKKYWTALLDMYAGPDAGKGVRRHWAARAAKPAREPVDASTSRLGERKDPRVLHHSLSC
jgi:hypothetical protein